VAWQEWPKTDARCVPEWGWHRANYELGSRRRIVIWTARAQSARGRNCTPIRAAPGRPKRFGPSCWILAYREGWRSSSRSLRPCIPRRYTASFPVHEACEFSNRATTARAAVSSQESPSDRSFFTLSAGFVTAPCNQRSSCVEVSTWRVHRGGGKIEVKNSVEAKVGLPAVARN
jgi:hypothetical protein